MRSIIVTAAIVILLLALGVSSAMAAQGQITDVNPSGIGNSVHVSTPGADIKLGDQPPSAKGVIVDVNPSGVSGVVNVINPGLLEENTVTQ